MIKIILFDEYGEYEINLPTDDASEVELDDVSMLDYEKGYLHDSNKIFRYTKRKPNIRHIMLDYKPTPQEKEIINRTNNMFQMARKARSEVTKLWREAESLYQGKHWEGMNMPSYQNQITVDLIASAIDTMIPILTSRPPKD